MGRLKASLAGGYWQKLQDHVPPFAFDQAKIIIEAELGKPLFEIYERFEVEPPASASIGQVHRARLITGEDVKNGING